MFTFRPQQEKCFTAIEDGFGRGVTAQVVVAATGFGKSVCIAEVTRRISERTLVLDHRDELTTQNGRKLTTVNPTAYIEREDGKSGPSTGDADIIVGSVQALARSDCKRLRRLLRYRPFGLLHIDEVHHAASETYQDIIACCKEYNPDLKMIGWTATPKRTDKKPLTGFQEVTFSYPLRQAIEEGWLVDIEPYTILSRGTSLDNVKMKGGDFADGSLSKEINTPERNAKIVNGWLQHAKGLQTLIFCVDVQHVRDLTDLFCVAKVKAEMVVGSTPDYIRDATFKRFADRETQVLINCMVASEGTDIPGIEAIVMARPTQSQLIYLQQLGRGTRTDCEIDRYATVAARLEAIARSHKPTLKLFDVVDNCTKHSPIMLPDIFGIPRKIKLHGTPAVKAIQKIEKAQQEAGDKGGSLNIDKIRDIDKLQHFVTEALRVKIWDIEPPKEVKQHSHLNWSKQAGEYTLQLNKHETIVLRPNALGKVETVIRSDADHDGEKWIKRATTFEHMGESTTLPEAFARTDRYVEQDYPKAMILLKQSAGWHNDAATPKQVGWLKRKGINVRDIEGKPMIYDDGWRPLTKGLAAQQINRTIRQYEKAS